MKQSLPSCDEARCIFSLNEAMNVTTAQVPLAS